LFYDNKPKEPAVTPMVTKKQNSNKSLEPGGNELIIISNWVIYACAPQLLNFKNKNIALRQEQHNQL